jgi:hypothetical protein
VAEKANTSGVMDVRKLPHYLIEAEIIPGPLANGDLVGEIIDSLHMNGFFSIFILRTFYALVMGWIHPFTN